MRVEYSLQNRVTVVGQRSQARDREGKDKERKEMKEGRRDKENRGQIRKDKERRKERKSTHQS